MMKRNNGMSQKTVLTTAAALAVFFHLIGSFSELSIGPFLSAQTRSASSRTVVRSEDSQARIAQRYRRILLNNPGYGAAFDQVYRAETQKDGCESFVSELQKEIELSEGETKGKRLFLLGLVYLRMDDAKGAIDALTAAEELLPRQGAVPSILGRALILQGRMREGCVALERALNKELADAERVETLEKLGATYARLEEREKAEEVWKNAIEKFGDNPDILRSIADVQADAGLYRQANELYAKLERDAKSRNDVQAEIEFAVACGDMKTRLGEKEGAIEDFERALDKLSPDHWLFKSLRDRVEYAYLLRSDYDGLVDHYRARVEKRPNDVDAIRRLVVTLGALARYEDAQAVLSAARTRAPKDAALCRSALELALAQNDYKRADELYAELDAVSPGDLDVCLAWGDVVLKNDSLDAQTRKERAVELWTRALKDESTPASSALLIADKLAENGFDAEAEAAFQRTVDAYPDDFECRASLARFYLKKDERDKAFAALDGFTAKNANDPAAWDRRAAFLRSVGYAAEAIDAARRACELTPGDFRRALYLCDCESNASGRADEADLQKAEELAETENEREQVFGERMKLVRAQNEAGEYLASIDEQLANCKDAQERAWLYWRKAACCLAFDDPNGAADATVDALRADAVSPALARKIQEIAAKSQSPERSLELLDLAIERDQGNAANYWRSRVRVCLEMGKADEAIESARKLVELGPGAAENYRAYAEALLECGRYDDAIEALRTAASGNTSDRMSQLKLAALLDEVGKTDEAIDVLWQVFSRASRLEEKLSLVDSLSKLSAKVDKFDAFKERLQTSSKTADARRENAYCLARAYMALKDYDSARTTLENAVAFMGARADDSGFWLHALSNLAELQNDIEGAIRFQEQLCELDASAAERGRLLELYRRSGDTARARDYLVKKILPTEPLWRRLETVDALASLEEYPLANAILDELDRGFPNNWEVLARRLTLAGWTQSPELPELIAKTLARTDAWNAKSSKAAALEFDPNTVATTVSGDSWAVGPIAGRAVVALAEPKDYRDLAAQTLTVVYRGRLELKDKNARSLATTLAKPQKPIPSYPTFGAARFEALAWQARLERKETPADPKQTDARAALETRYLLDAYNLCRVEAGLASDSELDADELRKRLRQTSLALSEFDPAWRVEAFPTVMDDLVAANDAAAVEKDSAFLIGALERSLELDRVKNDADVWKQASFLAGALESKSRGEDAARVRELIKSAGKRDYSVLINADPDAAYEPFEAFEESWKSVEAEVLRQTRNKDDVTRAREALGDALAARLKVETANAFLGADSDAVERIKKNGDICKTLVEKASFGHAVVNSFITLNRRDLFDVQPSDAVDGASADAFEKKLYRILTFAADADARLAEFFAQKEGTRLNGGSAIPVANALGYLERATGTNYAMAAYLVDNTLYATVESSSVMESSAALEYAFGALFALDVVTASPEEQVKGAYRFERLERLLDFLGERYGDSADAREKLRAQQILETSNVLMAAARGEVETESVEGLKEKALDGVALFGENAPQSAALLIALAMLSGADAEKKLEYVERVNCVSFSETKARELAILTAFKDSNDPQIASRRDSAVQTLAGARLDEKEASKFWTALRNAGYAEEALKTRRRLESFAASDTVVEALLDDILARVKSSETPDDADVVFALRIFRTPSTSLQSGGKLAELRAKALAALNAAGKLDETLAKMETQLADAPGAYEMALRLADVKVQLGDVESAKTLLRSVEKRAPNDPAILFDYASTLARAGESERAKTVLKGVYAKKLEDFFRNEARPDFWTFDDDAAFIEATDFDQIAPYAFYAFSILLAGIDESEPERTERAYAAIARLWACDGAAPETRETLHSAGARTLAQSEDPRFFPCLCDYMIESVAPNAKENEPYPAFQDIHRIVRWSDNAPITLSIYFLQSADKERDAEALNTLLDRVDAACAVYAARPDENPARHSAALVLAVMIRLKLGEFDAAMETLAAAERFDSFCAPEFKSDPLALCLAFEYFAGDRLADAGETLLKYYRKGYEVNTHMVYEPYFITRIYPLGMRSKDSAERERYAGLALKRLQEIMRLAAKADVSSDRRVGGSMETVDTVALYAETLGEAFISVGSKEVFVQALNETGLDARLDAPNEDAIEPWKAFFAKMKEMKEAE